MAEEASKISTKDILFYFLIAILIISLIVVLAIFSNKPKNAIKIKKLKNKKYDYTEVQIENNRIYYSKNYKKIEKQILEDKNENTK